jgi:hypothetical protein
MTGAVSGVAPDGDGAGLGVADGVEDGVGEDTTVAVGEALEVAVADGEVVATVAPLGTVVGASVIRTRFVPVSAGTAQATGRVIPTK